MNRIRPSYPDIQDERFWQLLAAWKPHSLLSVERFYALYNAVIYVTRNNIPGAIAECGVFHGGASGFCAQLLVSLGDTHRDFIWFDTFEGFPEDVAEPAIDGTVLTRESWYHENFYDLAMSNFAKSGYPTEKLKANVGPVEEALPRWQAQPIALLNLDTDYYRSTKLELEYMYPHLVPGGVLNIDDYGHFQGARQAVEEYFAHAPLVPLFHRTDYTGRMGLKPAT